MFGGNYSSAHQYAGAWIFERKSCSGAHQHTGAWAFRAYRTAQPSQPPVIRIFIFISSGPCESLTLAYLSTTSSCLHISYPPANRLRPSSTCPRMHGADICFLITRNSLVSGICHWQFTLHVASIQRILLKLLQSTAPILACQGNVIKNDLGCRTLDR
jgi:hypothetical protein